MARPGRRWPGMWCPAREQTRLPARSAGPRTGESFGHQQPLARFEVHRRERDQLGTCAGDRRRLGEDVDGLVLHRLDALRRSVSRRKSTLSGSPSRSRAISRAMSTLKPCSSPDTGSRKLNRLVLWSTPTINRPRRRIASTVGAARGGRAQTRCGIAAFDRRAGHGRRHLGPAGHRQRGERRGNLGQRLHLGAAGDQHRRQYQDRCDGTHQWYSLSRGAIPAATASAASTLMAAAPNGRRFSAV